MFNTGRHHIILMMTVWWDRTVAVEKKCFQRDLSKTELKTKNFFPVLSGVRAAGACLVRMYLVERGDLAKHYRRDQLSSSTRKKLEVASLLYRNVHEGLKYETVTLQTNYRLSNAIQYTMSQLC